MTPENLCQKIIECLIPNPSPYCDSKIEFDLVIDKYQITISQMYSYLPLNFGMLIQLSELLGTQNIKTEQESFGGCETCDYGSSYQHILLISDVTKHEEQLKELCGKKEWLQIS